MSAVSAMKCTPQKTIASAWAASCGLRELEGVAHEVGVLHHFVPLVEVAEDHHALAQRMLRRPNAQVKLRRGGALVLARKHALHRSPGGMASAIDAPGPYAGVPESKSQGASASAAEHVPAALPAACPIWINCTASSTESTLLPALPQPRMASALAFRSAPDTLGRRKPRHVLAYRFNAPRSYSRHNAATGHILVTPK